MREVNFLPHQIKDRMFKKKKNFINCTIVLMVIVNIIITLHIYQGIHGINLKENIQGEAESEVLNNNSYKEKPDALDFFQRNIVGHFLYEGANLKGSILSLKIIIKDKNEFSEYVKELEAIKKCTIEYLIAPYEENAVLKFEVGLEVKE